MTDKEKKLFNEICYAVLIYGCKVSGSSISYDISPDYITEKSEKRDTAPYFYQGLHPLLRNVVKEYCERWNLPLKQWLDDLGIIEPTLDI